MCVIVDLPADLSIPFEDILADDVATDPGNIRAMNEWPVLGPCRLLQNLRTAEFL